MRFFLDNCLAVRHARALHELLKPEHECEHLQNYFPAATKDVTWITKLGEEGGWIVISGDYRIGKNPHEKAAWHKSGLMVFFLAKGWMNIPFKEQHSKLWRIFDDIIEHAQKAKPGTGFMISIGGKIECAYTP
jgi:PIN like domain